MAQHSCICNGCIHFDSKTNTELNAEKCENCNGQSKEWHPINKELYLEDPYKYMKHIILGSQ